jgi:hypothetical protein
MKYLNDYYRYKNLIINGGKVKEHVHQKNEIPSPRDWA